jgi:hypothetical protein
MNEFEEGMKVIVTFYSGNKAVGIIIWYADDTSYEVEVLHYTEINDKEKTVETFPNPYSNISFINTEAIPSRTENPFDRKLEPDL